MMHTYVTNYAGAFTPSSTFMPGFLAGWFSMFLIPLAFWSVIWMGIALWTAARKGSKPWFIALLLVHTCGILDILYIFVFSKMNEGKRKITNKSK